MSFVVVGHRGALALEPENTLRSFRRAAAEGADQIELDLHLSRDGELVIMHDLTVDRTTDGSGAIADLTLEELRALDAGEGERIPTFDEALDVIDRPLQAEVKAADAARAVVDTIRRRDLYSRVIVTSFDAEVVRLAKEFEPDVRTGLISSRAPADSVELAKRIGAELLCLGLTWIDREIVDSAHAEGLEVVGWMANSPEQALRGYRLGIDGVTSDFPNLKARTARELPELRDAIVAFEAELASANGSA